MKDITYLRDLQRKNNLLIQNVPSSPSENLKDIVKKVANACGSDLNPTDIASVMRLQTKPTTNPLSTPNRPRSNDTILVKFVDTTVKDSIFDGYIKMLTDKKPLISTYIGFEGNTRIYLNQHLSPDLIKVKMRAVKLKEARIISKVSAAYNVVKVQYKDKWHKLYSFEQLQTLIPEMSN